MIIGSGALTERKDNALALGAAGKSPCALSASSRDLHPNANGKVSHPPIYTKPIEMSTRRCYPATPDPRKVEFAQTGGGK